MGTRVDIPQLAIENATEEVCITVVAMVILVMLNCFGYYFWSNVKSAYNKLKEENETETSPETSEINDQYEIPCHDGVRVREFAQNMDIYPIPTQYSSPGTVSFNPYNGKMTYIEY